MQIFLSHYSRLCFLADWKSKHTRLHKQVLPFRSQALKINKHHNEPFTAKRKKTPRKNRFGETKMSDSKRCSRRTCDCILKNTLSAFVFFACTY